MKIQLLVPVLLSALIVSAQERSTIPMKKSNRVIVSNTLSAQENYKALFSALADDGYSVDRRDNEFLTIRTQPRSPNKTAVNVMFNFLAKDSTVVVWGSFSSRLSISLWGVKTEQGFVDIENIGMKGSEYKDAFNAMVKVAALIPGTIYYEKR